VKNNITNLRKLVAKDIKPLISCSIDIPYTISHPVPNSHCMTQSRLQGNSHPEALVQVQGAAHLYPPGCHVICLKKKKRE
jgi:hypothetical protein